MTRVAVVPRGDGEAALWRATVEVARLMRELPWVMVGGQMVMLLELEHGRPSGRATRDLDAIVDAIGPDSSQRAVDFITEIAGVCTTVMALDPTAGDFQSDFNVQMYCFVARGRLIFYTFEPAFHLIHFYRVVSGQDAFWRDLEN